MFLRARLALKPTKLTFVGLKSSEGGGGLML